nr:zinc finger, CCHC-type [Tanacetum cinerariifolium]
MERLQDDAKRLFLVDDLKKLNITIMSRNGPRVRLYTKEGLKNYSQKVETASRILATPSGLLNDSVREFVTVSGLTSKLRNDIFIFQQHQGESLSEAWTHFKDLLQKVPYHGIDLWLQIQIFYDYVNPITRRTIDQATDAHLAPNQPIQVNKITSSCEICSGPHDTQYCMENPEQAFVDYASSRTDEAGGALPSDIVKNPKLNLDSTSYARSYPTWDPESSFNSFKSVNAIQTCFKSTTNIQKEQLLVNTLTVNETETPKPKRSKESLEDEFADLHLNLPVLEGLLEETEDVLGLVSGTKSYPIGIMKIVEVHVGKLRLFEDFHVVDMEREPTCPLLVGRGFLVAANAIIDYKKDKIAVGEGLTRSIFDVREIHFGEENVPYWTIIGKRESYKPRTSEDYIGA